MGRASGAPRLLNYQFYMNKNPKIHTKTHTQNMQIHINMCKHVEKHIKKYKHLQEEHLA